MASYFVFSRECAGGPCVSVGTGDTRSALFMYDIGVRQGCSASPVLFNLYINNLFDGLSRVTTQLERDLFPACYLLTMLLY
ncbi:RNA-directed DNA polymerase, Non LTR Retrotransposon [Trachipleistophora hominis]|uniref:RNA-directed DNA polymerase, Non LTR Retrotransposon n=1 Tax=Trachipleistophora hominis TaxID=72359 RepID=L7JZW4_TRAHO|nr:RNA-directed DNA polymerase, Non LTR Retrotransposon [Trachipleistophora hominis]